MTLLGAIFPPQLLAKILLLGQGQEMEGERPSLWVTDLFQKALASANIQAQWLESPPETSNAEASITVLARCLKCVPLAEEGFPLMSSLKWEPSAEGKIMLSFQSKHNSNATTFQKDSQSEMAVNHWKIEFWSPQLRYSPKTSQNTQPGEAFNEEVIALDRCMEEFNCPTGKNLNSLFPLNQKQYNEFKIASRGLVWAQAIPKGKQIQLSQLMVPNKIEMGQIVTLCSQNQDLIKVCMQAKSLESAPVGKMVRLKILDGGFLTKLNQTEIKAKLQESGELLIEN